MTELVRMYNMRQTVRNEKENVPIQVAQELLNILVANAHIGFSRVWLPVPQAGFPHSPFY